MRLRTLTEAECYTRCYGTYRSDRVTVLHGPPDDPHRQTPGEQMRKLFEQRLDSRGPEAEAA
jgi:hypothetical protein